MMKWQLKELSDSWEQWVTSELTVEEWCGESATVRRSKSWKNGIVTNGKLKLTISKCTSVKVFNQTNSLTVGF